MTAASGSLLAAIFGEPGLGLGNLPAGDLLGRGNEQIATKRATAPTRPQRCSMVDLKTNPTNPARRARPYWRATPTRTSMNKPTQRFDAVVRPRGGPARTDAETPVAAIAADPAQQPAAPSAQNEFVKGPFTRIPATDGVHVQPVAVAAAAVQVPAKE